jgi:restriction system protein
MSKIGDIPDIPVPDADEGATASTELHLCPACGWWRVMRDAQADFGESHNHPDGVMWHRRNYGVAGALKTLDLSDLTAPLEEVRSYLTARYDARFDVHPKRFEDVVRSVFSDLGYDARTTSYSNDGGVDVVLDGDDDATIGVQVKRYRARIEVEQIRAFLGALILGSYTRGIFVTTSKYRSGAQRAAHLSHEVAVPIELLDADAFFDALKLAQLTSNEVESFTPPVDLLDFYSIPLYSYDYGGCNSNKVVEYWDDEFKETQAT